jgi:hypothetical protein
VAHGNTVVGNTYHGILGNGAMQAGIASNVVTANNLTQPTGAGIELMTNATNNYVKGNHAGGNLPWDLQDDSTSPPCNGSNIWTGDVFGTGTPASSNTCVQ